MTRDVWMSAALILAAISSAACSRDASAKAPNLGDPPPVVVEHVGGNMILQVDHPERYQLALAGSEVAHPELTATGVVTADVSRNIPVVSVASGRIIEVRTRLGDHVRKGQVIMRVESADVADAFSAYRQGMADDKLAEAQLARSRDLYAKGAIAKKDLEIAEDAEEKADVEVEAAIERLKVLGADRNHPTSIVDVVAPASGIITDQQVTAAAGTQGLASPNAFAISDLSHVWIVCDVYENDLPMIQVGEYADIQLSAYPHLVLRGRIGNIGAILDSNIRTAKVRIELQNPGQLLLGMFVHATFHGSAKQIRSTVPTSAVLHLHDRDWVYVPNGSRSFRRVEVQCGPDSGTGQQQIVSGVRPGDRVVANALLLENTADQ